VPGCAARRRSGVTMQGMSAPVRYALLGLSIPAALAGYWLTGQLLFALGLETIAGGLLLVFLPLLGAGLCALPFIAPFFDHLAKQALADAPSRRAADPEHESEPRTPGPPPD
jgi:hypothetical protein